MIRITSLDMPKNDYIRYVKKTIFELNLKEDGDPDKQVKMADPYDEYENFVANSSPPKKVKNNVEEDDINSNSVLEINHIIDSDDRADEEEPEPIPTNKPAEKSKSAGKARPKAYKPASNANQGALMIKELPKT